MPILLVRMKTLGACFSWAMPYRVRDALSMKELPALQALVRTTKLMMWGTTLMPARVAAMTKGDAAAVPESALRSWGSLEGTSMPTKKMLST